MIDQWGEARPFLKEWSLLDRTRRLYDRHPQARVKTRSTFDSILGGPLSDAPPGHEQRLRAWVEGDEELFEFLRTTRFDLAGRVKFVQQALSEWKARVGEGKVTCPTCGTGAVAMAVEKLG